MRFFLVILFSVVFSCSFAQNLIPEFWANEVYRRNQLLGIDSLGNSFSLRAFKTNFNDFGYEQKQLYKSGNHIKVFQSPVFLNSKVLNKRPYGFGDGSLTPVPGFQSSIITGFSANWKFIRFDFQPEYFFSTNSKYNGFSSGFKNEVNIDLFLFYNASDYPERFGDGIYSRLGWGQSSFMFQFGSFESGVSTKNIWWGPGQWNSLIFSTNAPGFPHLTFKTKKPAKTFLGKFEGEIIAGRLENSGFEALQNEELNNKFFRPFTGDWRYLNGITLTYSPKWVNGLSFGFSRTFQVYNDQMGNSFSDFLPIFEAFQKKGFFQNGNTVDFDENGRDQQVSIFARVVIPQVKTELYFEFGKRDHSFNWREFILNPEHARAFIFGFNKLLDYGYKGYNLQIRGEITHQQESINRILRYGPKGGALTWHTHSRARGFSNLGQPLGVGLGIGSNSQTLEMAMVENLNKFGLLLERLENNQDFFYRAFSTQSELKPWVDLSLGFLYDKQFNNLLLSSKLQLIHARNYQWQLDPASTPDFPKGKNLTSVMGQVSAIYFWKKKEKRD